MNDTAQSQNLPAAADPALKSENAALREAASEDASFSKLLKYKQGEWWCDDVMVPLGTKFLAHCVGYTKTWLKFGKDEAGNPKMLERRQFSSLDKHARVPKRDELDDNDPTKWAKFNDKPNDPWVMQTSIPMENEQGDIALFVARAFGGKRCISDLVTSYANRSDRIGRSEQPIVELATGTFPSPKWGRVKCPMLKIVGWDSVKEGIRTVTGPDTLADEMNDEIPF